MEGRFMCEINPILARAVSVRVVDCWQLCSCTISISYLARISRSWKVYEVFYVWLNDILAMGGGGTNIPPMLGNPV